MHDISVADIEIHLLSRLFVFAEKPGGPER